MTITDERLAFELAAAKDGLGRIAGSERFTWEGRAACVALSAIQRLEALAMDALNELKEGENMKPAMSMYETGAAYQAAMDQWNAEQVRTAGAALTSICHGASVKAGWWNNLQTGERLQRNKGEMLMLIVSEIAEAMEGVRKNLPDDKLPARKMEEVEMADAVIRIADYCGAHGLDLGGAIADKLAYNASREDHKPENRRGENGKKF